MKLKLLSLSLVLYCGIFSSYGQVKRGKVVSNSEATKSIPFAKVYFIDRGITLTTDSLGILNLTDLPLGHYHTIVKASGYKTAHTDIELIQNQELILTLEPLHFELDKVIVSNNGYLHRESITNVESRSMKDLESIQNTTLGQSIANIPGVYQTGIGVGISKPVIRGLSGSSVVTYLNGLRIQNQQWGSDHGLPITSLGIGDVEVIKGPASLLYGADALGGVLYFVDESYAEKNTLEGFLSSRFETNSLGTANQGGIKYAKGKIRFNAYAGYDNFADYAVPNTSDKNKVLNSRFNQTSGKIAFGYSRKRWVLDARYNFYQARLGLPGHTHDVNPDVSSFLTINQNRDRNVPAQVILNNFLSVENKFFFDKNEFYITLGNTNNNLKEHEEKFFFPDIIMNLNNTFYNVKWRSKVSSQLETIVGSQGMAQLHMNGTEAVEILIPNTNTFDAGVYGLVKYKKGKFRFLGGLRLDNRQIATASDALNTSYQGFNYSAGFARMSEKTTFRFNVSSGFRAPNASELLSDGVHHGSFRYEKGNASLKTEKAFQLDASLALHFDDLELVVNPFLNTIQDYIYLEKADSLVGQFQVYNFTQAETAMLYGADLGLHYHPHKAHWLHLESTFSNVFAEDNARNPLPLIPQTRINNQISIDFGNKNNRHFQLVNYVFQHQYFFKQNRLGILETETPGFNILNSSINAKYIGKKTWLFSLGARNILNTRYIDHLSGIKDLGIPNPGFNVYLSVKYQFSKQLKQK